MENQPLLAPPIPRRVAPMLSSANSVSYSSQRLQVGYRGRRRKKSPIKNCCDVASRSPSAILKRIMPATKPQLAAFPKAYMDPLTLTGEMTLAQWFDICKDLKVDGTELYCNFKELKDPKNWPTIKKQAADRNLPIPMLCCSPDFTHQ